MLALHFDAMLGDDSISVVPDSDAPRFIFNVSVMETVAMRS